MLFHSLNFIATTIASQVTWNFLQWTLKNHYFSAFSNTNFSMLRILNTQWLAGERVENGRQTTPVSHWQPASEAASGAICIRHYVDSTWLCKNFELFGGLSLDSSALAPKSMASRLAAYGAQRLHCQCSIARWRVCGSVVTWKSAGKLELISDMITRIENIRLSGRLQKYSSSSFWSHLANHEILLQSCVGWRTWGSGWFSQR